MASKTRKSKRTSHSRHKYPKSTNGSGFLGLVIVVLGIWYWFWYRPSETEIPETYAEQISQLDALEHGLENLQDFVASQRQSLVQQNNTLDSKQAYSGDRIALVLAGNSWVDFLRYDRLIASAKDIQLCLGHSILLSLAKGSQLIAASVPRFIR